MERPRAARLCSITVLLGAALLLPTPGGAQVSPHSPPHPPATLRDKLAQGDSCVSCATPWNPPLSPQAPRDTEWQGVATEQDLAKETILGVQSVEALEEGETSNGLQPGIKVFSSSAWAQWGPRQAQVGPEEDRDHLHHPQDDAREDDPHGLPQTLALEVQSGPEEDRDHLHHG
ncbi:proline-rich acidic protein 1-like isoform X4 [Athene cunicularia]|uniref:proline-rich acidic protein 1-like isoform X4 n=1 Tax=Athene cunicularia TaxID=194338 RepID=UPI000EF712A5|nr:proline-rich acidic protein 1-like isoform X4 [Athene cunicularia]